MITSVSIGKRDLNLSNKAYQRNVEKFKMEESKPVSTPMVTGCKLGKDDEYLEVDHTMYRSMIGSVLYVTTTRPDVMQVVGVVSI